MTTHQPPAQFSLSVEPYKVTSAARQFSEPVTLANHGTTAVRVSAKFEAIEHSGGGCALTRAPSWVSVSPASFTLQPGQHLAARITVSAPASAAGSYDLAAVFAGVPQSAHGLTVSGAVGERVELAYPGKTAGRPCVMARPPAAAGHPAASPVPDLAGLGVAVAAIVAGLAAWRRRRRNRRRARQEVAS